MSLLNLDEIPARPFPLSRVGVTQALVALGRTRDEVAETLLAGGHWGRSADAMACPVAEYLKKTYPDYFVFVSADGVTVSWVADVAPPDAVAEFVQRFDADPDAYPELQIDFGAPDKTAVT